MSKRLLHEKGIDKVLSTILENPAIAQNTLIEKTGLPKYRVLKLVDMLDFAELIIIERGKNNRKLMTLNEKGVELAKQMEKTRDILDS